MLLIVGEVRKVLDNEYKNKNGELVKQAILVIEPVDGRQNYEVFLNSSQIDAGTADAWSKLIGQNASVAVSLFVNHQYKFYKYNALGTGQPLKPFKG